jgi:hypothetical protein
VGEEAGQNLLWRENTLFAQMANLEANRIVRQFNNLLEANL